MKKITFSFWYRICITTAPRSCTAGGSLCSGLEEFSTEQQTLQRIPYSPNKNILPDTCTAHCCLFLKRLFLLSVNFSLHTGQTFHFPVLTSEAPCWKTLSMCTALHLCPPPAFPTERLNGSHSVAFGDVTPWFGLGKDLKCAIPCTGEAPWKMRFDGNSTKLSVLFPVSVLGLDTKTTTLLGAETWDLPCSSELPTCATLC